MKRKARNKKGTVGIHARNGMLELRWTYQRRQRRKALGLADTPTNRHIAKAKTLLMEADMAYDRFDATLAKYFPSSEPVSTGATTARLFEAFIKHRREEGTSEQTINAKYWPMLANLKRFEQSIADIDTARAFVEVLRDRQSPRVANQNLTLLKAFGGWCAEQGWLTANPYKAIKPVKAKQRPQNRRPFTRDEVTRFLEALRTDATGYRYYDFCLVMFALALRPSEAIGLRWSHVDLERGRVTICETMARSEDGRSSGRARRRKSTKTENSRTLPLSSQLVALFKGRQTPECQPDDLVFTSPAGKPIDDRNFRKRIWKRICEKAEIDYRPPYVARHTGLSHGIEFAGWTLPQAAHIAGHTSTRMVAETYGHIIDLPDMPEY